MKNVYKMARYKMALDSIYSIVEIENYPKVELIKDIIEKAFNDTEALEDDRDDVDR